MWAEPALLADSFINKTEKNFLGNFIIFLQKCLLGITVESPVAMRFKAADGSLSYMKCYMTFPFLFVEYYFCCLQ